MDTVKNNVDLLKKFSCKDKIASTKSLKKIVDT